MAMRHEAMFTLVLLGSLALDATMVGRGGDQAVLPDRTIALWNGQDLSNWDADRDSGSGHGRASYLIDRFEATKARSTRMILFRSDACPATRGREAAEPYAARLRQSI